MRRKTPYKYKINKLYFILNNVLKGKKYYLKQ